MLLINCFTTFRHVEFVLFGQKCYVTLGFKLFYVSKYKESCTLTYYFGSQNLNLSVF